MLLLLLLPLLAVRDCSFILRLVLGYRRYAVVSWPNLSWSFFRLKNIFLKNEDVSFQVHLLERRLSSFRQPLEDFAYFCAIFRPHFLFLHCTSLLLDLLRHCASPHCQLEITNLKDGAADVAGSCFVLLQLRAASAATAASGWRRFSCFTIWLLCITHTGMKASRAEGLKTLRTELFQSFLECVFRAEAQTFGTVVSCCSTSP